MLCRPATLLALFSRMQLCSYQLYPVCHAQREQCSVAQKTLGSDVGHTSPYILQKLQLAHACQKKEQQEKMLHRLCAFCEDASSGVGYNYPGVTSLSFSVLINLSGLLQRVVTLLQDLCEFC